MNTFLINLKTIVPPSFNFYGVVMKAKIKTFWYNLNEHVIDIKNAVFFSATNKVLAIFVYKQFPDTDTMS